MKRINWISIASLALTLALLAPLATTAQEEPAGPPIYIWINSIQAQPGQSEALTAMLIEQGSESYDPLLASGAAVNWGVAMNVVHDGGDPASHVEWISFVGWQAVDQFMQAFMAKTQTESAEDRAATAAAWEANVVDGSHSDTINQSVHLGGARSGRPGYIHLSYFEAASGQQAEVMSLWKEYAAPTFDQLATDGSIMAYGLHVPAVHRNYPWTHMSWYSSTDLAARDAVDAALAPPGEEMAARMEAAFDDFHEDQILMVVHFNEAAAE